VSRAVTRNNYDAWGLVKKGATKMAIVNTLDGAVIAANEGDLLATGIILIFSFAFYSAGEKSRNCPFGI
jgi:hypothetical protein